MHIINLNADELLEIAAKDLESVLGGLNIERLIPWDEVGVPPIERLTGKKFAALEHDQRRAVLDKIHDAAMLPVFEKNTPQERHKAHLSISQDVREAKWRYELALANSAYGLGYDYADLEILTPLAAQLALVERGATNGHMPTTHKLRHNPMSHSLNVVGLIGEVFADVEQKNPQFDEKEKSELASLKRQLMRAAVVHDMGELDGELSVARDRGRLTARQVAALEQARGHSETEVFTHYLDKRSASLENMRWPSELLKEKKSNLLNDYSIAEEAGVFAGRVHKILERVQSQQDYLRFSGKSMAPPLSTVIRSAGDHKEFTLNYALDPFAGATGGQKTGVALVDMVDDAPNPRLARAVYRGVEGKLSELQKQMAEALQYRPRTFAEKFMEGTRPSKGASR